MTRDIVIMGVSGSGKSTIGELLAERLGWPLIEADELHPESNIAKMSAGIPLTDEDRRPWLEKIVRLLNDPTDGEKSYVLVCSALRRSYRDILRTAGPLFFVHLDFDPDTIKDWLSKRKGHFMPASLLQSQLDTVERLQPDETGIELVHDGPPQEVLEHVMQSIPQSVVEPREN